MRCSKCVLLGLLALSVPVLAAGAADSSSFLWERWRHLPVQDGGRYKPMDTLARETLRTLGNRASFIDPESGEKLSSTALYLTMLFEWQAEDQRPRGHAAAPPGYFRIHKADRWDRAPLLRVDFLELRQTLGLSEDVQYISPLDLSRATIRDPRSGREATFIRWAESLDRSRKRSLSTFERKARELADNYWSYQDHRMGRRLRVLPIQGDEHQDWLSIADLLRSRYDDATDPTGALRKAKQHFLAARDAYLANAPEAFDSATADFVAAVAEFGPQLGPYPAEKTVELEVAYNDWVPFRFAWILTTLAFLRILLSMGTPWKPFYWAGLLTFTASLLAMLVGFAMRIAISGRAPVTNMYESVVYLGLGTAVFGLIFELICRKRYVVTAAAAISTLALILADNCPAVLDPSLHPLQPVLRNNFWLVTHVMSITLSYAAFALALGIGNVTLAYFLVRSKNTDVIGFLTTFTYRALQVGVLLLTVGTILGAVWAKYSWGRFWGWDPKEVWALIALLGYLAVLHARYIGWVREFGLAVLSVSCFALIVMAWYGVNVLLGAGLHTYGFSSGGQTSVYAVLVVQFLYVAAAALRSSKAVLPSQVENLPHDKEPKCRRTSGSSIRSQPIVPA